MGQTMSNWPRGNGVNPVSPEYVKRHARESDDPTAGYNREVFGLQPNFRVVPAGNVSMARGQGMIGALFEAAGLAQTIRGEAPISTDAGSLNAYAISDWFGPDQRTTSRSGVLKDLNPSDQVDLSTSADAVTRRIRQRYVGYKPVPVDINLLGMMGFRGFISQSDYYGNAQYKNAVAVRIDSALATTSYQALVSTLSWYMGSAWVAPKRQDNLTALATRVGNKAHIFPFEGRLQPRTALVLAHDGNLAVVDVIRRAFLICAMAPLVAGGIAEFIWRAVPAIVTDTVTKEKPK